LTPLIRGTGVVVRTSPSVPVTIAVGAAAGLAASWVKSQAEPVLQRMAEAVVPPTPAEKGRPAADPGNTAVMPPALVVDRAEKALTGRPASSEEKKALTPVLHYAMGTALGVGYALATRRTDRAAVGFGTAAGAVAFLATHATTLPAAGVQTPPQRLPAAWWVWEGGSHLLFGATLEAARRVWLRRR
jgi:putative membrane protein